MRQSSILALGRKNGSSSGNVVEAEVMEALEDANFGKDETPMQRATSQLRAVLINDPICYYIQSRTTSEGQHSDLKIFTAKDLIDISNLRMYEIKGLALDEAVDKDTQIDLSQQTPTFQGHEVIEALNNYARAYK